MTRRQITEYLEVDLKSEMWHCRRCGEELIDARQTYKRGCRVRERSPDDVHRQFGVDEEYHFAPHPDWSRILEYFCPGCATMVEVEYLPPGHPPTRDIELDIDSLQERGVAGE